MIGGKEDVGFLVVNYWLIYVKYVVSLRFDYFVMLWMNLVLLFDDIWI